jgi:hypothetical protein
VFSASNVKPGTAKASPYPLEVTCAAIALIRVFLDGVSLLTL